MHPKVVMNQYATVLRQYQRGWGLVGEYFRV